MQLEEMVTLIRKVWSDAMSDNGAIWEKSDAQLQKAKAEYPEIYSEALPIAREKGKLLA